MLDRHTNKPLITKVEGEKENVFFMCWLQKYMLSQVIFPLRGDIKMEQTQDEIFSLCLFLTYTDTYSHEMMQTVGAQKASHMYQTFIYIPDMTLLC